MPKIRDEVVEQEKPYWTTTDGETVRLYQGDVLGVLRKLPSASVQMVVSSPPYWALRDYGTASWEGGDSACSHEPTEQWLFDQTCTNNTLGGTGGQRMLKAAMKSRWYKPDGTCRCGAKRIDQQLGSEQRPDCLGWAQGRNCADESKGGCWATGCFICRMTLVFRETRRVLRDDGTLWLNLGSTYVSGKTESGMLVLRNNITEEEYGKVLKQLSTMPRMRRVDAQTEQHLQEVHEEAGELPRSRVPEVPRTLQGAQVSNRGGDGQVLLQELRPVGQSNKEELNTSGQLSNLRRGVPKANSRDEEEQNRKALLQPGVLVQLQSEGQPRSMVGRTGRSNESRGGEMEKTSSGQGQEDVPQVPLDQETRSAPHLPVRPVQGNPLGAEQRDNSLSRMSRSVQESGAGARGATHSNRSRSSARASLVMNKEEVPKELEEFFTPLGNLEQGNEATLPWRLALSLQADGWILRQDLIFHKLAPMPESVQNRCTKAHEYIFLLTKSSNYFYDAEAIREEVKLDKPVMQISQGQFSGPREQNVREFERLCGANKRSVWNDKDVELGRWLAVHHPELLEEFFEQSTHKRDVWSLTSQGYKGCHYATYSTKLITPCVLAGTSAFGCCDKCGAPWRRKVEVLSQGLTGGQYSPPGQTPHGNARTGQHLTPLERRAAQEDKLNLMPGKVPTGWAVGKGQSHQTADHRTDKGKAIRKEALEQEFQGGKGRDRSVSRNRNGITGSLEAAGSEPREVIDDWVPTCECNVEGVRPCIVLDIFMGSGSTAICALTNGRRAWGIDLNEEYLREHAIHRVEQWLMKNEVKELVPDLSRWQPVVSAPDDGPVEMLGD